MPPININAIVPQITIEGKSGANGAGPISAVCPYLSIIEIAEEDNSTPAFWSSDSWNDMFFWVATR